jgi:hypothetical protein
LFFSFGNLKAQDISGQDSTNILIGRVYDQYNKKNVSYAHVVNQTRASGTISDSLGVFIIRSSAGDTLFISAMGYQFDIIHVPGATTDTSFVINLIPRAYMLPEVVIHELNTYEKFKERFVEIQLDADDIHIPGIPHLKPRTIPKLQDTNFIRNPMFALSSPISFLYYNLSRKEKNRRKYNELIKQDQIREKAEKRIDTAAIMRITGLPRSEVEDFILFCEFNPTMMMAMTDYELYQYIRRKYSEYRE